MPENQSYKDIMETINVNRCFKQFRKIENIYLDIILEIHRTLTMDILNDDECGNIRKCSVYIQDSEHEPPRAKEVEERLINIIEQFNSSKKELEDIFIFK